MEETTIELRLGAHRQGYRQGYSAAVPRAATGVVNAACGVGVLRGSGFLVHKVSPGTDTEL
jgi:hypothetical protein